ncbi:MAG: DbpA RNA binding domain-containing protein [Methylococcales bacterium]|nr:DbpA RNA binding domain-containing protein [Methylococcales bacterium]
MESSAISAEKELERLEKRLKYTIGSQNLAIQREQIQSLAEKLDISLLDCAAALLFFCQPQAERTARIPQKPSVESLKAHYRFVRYRLDIGSQHQVGKEQIQAVLIEESGVDRKRIGKIDIRQNYTLVELPDGMPADIFQLLSEATIADRRLAIKRVKSNRRGAKINDKA